jgi:replicative DNA helicase
VNNKENKMVKVKSEEMITEYNQKILDILQETGASDVFSLIEGLQESLQALEKTIKNVEDQYYEFKLKSIKLIDRLDKIKKGIEKRGLSLEEVEGGRG